MARNAPDLVHWTDEQPTRVWDHCHTHGYVRAPLCNRCNTRNWRGWQPAFGRALPTRNLDTTYYQRCPEHGIDPDRHCSA